MSDSHFIVALRTLADNGTPIIINNACVSWRELAARFTYAGARAYAGTLIEVTPTEAHEVIVKLLEKHFDKLLPHAATIHDDRRLSTTPLARRSVMFRRTSIHRMARAPESWKRQVETTDPADKDKVKPRVLPDAATGAPPLPATTPTSR